ncbi:hypothetical protein RSOLAG22IIIB_13064 [Rhizoctonia solani]|uniref:Cleavage stimulation factor subunit 2 hinge domain-containing protein n=1 Tax=Rhizoctonia solani TaxID=456999 RepID=A0A0K6GIH3_9AGAM|nr:hypothetical protein RSOLAG22IIIB_13064 [Rhizoctonia solani]
MEEEKMFELLTSVKNMVKSDPTQARTALASHPNLAYALMKEMVVLDIVDPEVLTRTLQAATGGQPAQTQPPQPPQQQPYPPSNGTPSYPPYPAPGSTPTYPTPPQTAPYQQPPSSTPSYSTPTYPPSSTPTYPPTSALSYPPTSTPTYPPNYPPQPPQAQPQAPSIPPHVYQARQPPPPPPVQQQQAPMQARPPPSVPPAGMSGIPGLAPDQQAMVQRLALLTPDQIAALPPSDRAALIELATTTTGTGINYRQLDRMPPFFSVTLRFVVVLFLLV